MGKDQLGYQFVLDAMQDMVFVMRVSEDRQYFYYEFINKKALEILGLTSDIVGQEIANINPSPVTAVLHEKYREVIKGRDPLTYQDIFHAYDTNRVVSETTLTPLWVDDKVTKVVAVTRDITQLKEAELKRKSSEQKLKISRQRYKSLFQHNSDGILRLDLNGRLIRENNAFEKLTGRKAAFVRGISILDLVNEKDKRKVKTAFLQAIKGKPTYFETQIFTYFLKDAFLQVKLAPIILNKEIQGVYAIIKNTTSEHKMKQNLIESEAKFRLITENSYDLISLVDEARNLIYVSPSYGYVLGYPTDNITGESLLLFVHNDDHPLVNKAIAQSIDAKIPFTIEIRIKTSEKVWLWFELNGQPVFSENGQLKHMVTVGRDITVRKRYEERLKTLAYHDYLTGLPNRRLFQDYLNKVLAAFDRSEVPFAVMMLDLDNFKRINDQMGHDIGDEVIKEFGRRLQLTIREMDMVARMGGDEFVILLSEVESRQNVDQVVERIESSISDTWEIGEYNFQLTSSIGVVMPTCKGFTVKALIKHADKALYEAKNKGKNRSVITICS